jgi:hypothetical protein
VTGICVVRHHNEVGKGDHRRFGGSESPCAFTAADELLGAFERDIERWRSKNSDA